MASEVRLPLWQRVVKWQLQHGRHDLPWQTNRDPYRVWLSEIMLQQTQVAAVRSYFARFLQRFPDLQSLAAGTQAEVLGQWSGLGYYTRARNLHACAQQIVAVHGGQFPQSAQTLQTLPGIGRSTAAAISSMCFGEPAAILDGNVKRVLTRYLGFDKDLSQAANERLLWAAANQLVPHLKTATHMPTYTQGMMDLGAMVCLAKKPLCNTCPLQADCAAYKQQNPQAFPVKTRKVKRSALSLWLLWMQDDHGAICLPPRPGKGIWGGLHCFPVFEGEDTLRAALGTLSQRLVFETPFVHVLTHKDLHLHPVRLTLNSAGKKKLASAPWVQHWVDAKAWQPLGLPAPVRKLLENAGAQAQLSFAANLPT